MNKLVLSLALLTSFPVAAFSQSGAKLEMSHFFDSIFSVGEAQKSFPGLSYAYVGNDTSFVGSYGKIEWGSQEGVTPSTHFQLGSVGKVLTAIAVLQLVEDDKLKLDADISNYLEIELDRYEDSEITLKTLLTHSAGMNDRNIGYFSKDASTLVGLEQHLISNLPSFYQSPGLEINYSNYSYALAGYIVEAVSGVSFHEYVKQKILDPLGMQESFIGFDFNYNENPKYAKGHSKAADGFEANQEYARHAIPAGSFISTARDMQKLLTAFLVQDSIVLNSDSWKMLFTRQFSKDAQLSGYSLGLEEQISNGKAYWSKGGMLSGFLCQIIFWPDSTAMFIAVNTNNDEFLEQFHSEINKKFSKDYVRNAPPYQMVDLSKYSGEYRNARYDRDGVENIVSLFRGAFYVWEGDSSLLAWHNGEMQSYDYIGNHTFQNRSNQDVKMVFTEEDDRIVKLYRNVNIGGLNVPSTFEKTKWFNSPTFINEFYGVIPLGIGLYFFVLISAVVISVVRTWKPDFWKRELLPGIHYFVALLGIVVVITHILKVLLPMVSSPLDLLFGLSEDFLFHNNLSVLIIAVSGILWVLLVYALINRKGTHLARAWFSILTLLMTIHSWFLIYWNFV